jgi:DNA-binding CsgD family transcriptional regulator/tetratricopeptide (TPR) repeat protein
VLPGRDAAIATIVPLIDGARGGASAALIVHGDPGIGKTALLDEIVAIAHGFTVLRARPLQTESELPFAGLSDLLRPLLPLLGRIPAPQAAALAGALAIGPPTPGDRFTAAAATLSLLAAGAEDAPLLAVVDDAHWLDAPSREAILFAGRRLAKEGVILLMAMREQPWLRTTPLARLELPGLDPRTSAGLLAATGRAIDPRVRDRLVAETGGNPLALLEAVAMLSDGELAGSLRIAGPITIGATLERAFAERLEPLPDRARRALLVAAASDTGDAGEIVRALADMGLAPAELEVAERQGLIAIEADRLEFRHPLLRAATLRAADPADRRAAHLALAASLGPDVADRIAWHVAAATTSPDERAARLLEAAAASAQARHAYTAAATAFATAARLSPAQADRVRRTIDAATASWMGGETQTAIDALAGIVSLATDPLLRAEIQQLRATAMLFAVPVRETHSLLVAEADRLGADGPEQAATMLSLASLASTGTADIGQAVETARRAVELAPSTGPSSLLSAFAYANSLALAGRVTEARAILEPLAPVVETLDPLGEASFLVVQVSQVGTWLEDWGPARRLIERAVNRAREASAVSMLPYRLAILAELDLRCGRTAPAYSAASESVQLASEIGQNVDRSIGLVTLARIEAVLGREEACRDHVAAALDDARRLGMTAIENYAAAALGLLELGLGHPERAAAHLVECSRLELRHGLGLPTVVHWQADLVEAYVRSARVPDARRELDVFEERARSTGSRWATAAAARCRRLLADEDAYEEILVQALDLHGDDEPFERARTALCLGRRRRHARHRAAAVTALREALVTFDVQGAEPWAEEARIELRAAGETPVRSPGGSLVALTPQELQVALIVARGASNKEAAAALFLSPKTVEFHLGHIFRKVDVRSRTELAVKVAGWARSDDGDPPALPIPRWPTRGFPQ